VETVEAHQLGGAADLDHLAENVADESAY
ncbi:hypothetical protein LCGC14_2881950, partial [marine sediment metagenome]